MRCRERCRAGEDGGRMKNPKSEIRDPKADGRCHPKWDKAGREARVRLAKKRDRIDPNWAYPLLGGGL